MGNAVAELDALRGKVEEAERRGQGVVDAETAAKKEFKAARVSLAQVEQSDPTAKQLTAARERLEKARQAVEVEPWAERRELVKDAIRRAQAEMRVYAKEHFVEIDDEHGQEAAAVAERVNATARTFLEACAALHAVEQRVITDLCLALPSAGEFVTRAGAERARAAVKALLEGGGPVAPTFDYEAARRTLRGTAFLSEIGVVENTEVTETAEVA